MTRQHALVLGELDLTDPASAYATRADDASFGNPQPVEVAIRSLLADGTIVATKGHDNREAFFRVRITAGSGTALAEAEAALVAELGKRNELRWTPPAGWGPTTVFDVLTSSLEHVLDDLAELRLERTYGLRLVCLPFGRSVRETVAEAIVSEAVPVTVTVDNCSSATGWTLTPGSGVPTVDSGALKFGLNLHAVTDNTRWRPNRSAVRVSTAVDMSNTRYLSIDAKVSTYNPTSSKNVYPRLHVDGAELVQIAAAPAPTAGWTRYTFLCPDTSFTRVEVEVRGLVVYTVPQSHPIADMWIDNLIRTNQAPTTGTARQSIRSVTVKGAVRTPASLTVEHATSALGDVLVYSHPDLGDGYQPPLRTWRSSGGTVTTDAATVSGAREPVSATQFDVPLVLLPAGGYVLMARVRAVTSAGLRTLTATARTRVGAVDVGSLQTATTRVNLTSTATWQIVPIGGFTLPPTDVPPGSAGVARVALTAAGGSVEIDEAWLFKMTGGGSLTQVACGVGTPAAGTPSNRLWLDSPTVDRPLPGLWVGTQADRSDARHAGPDAAAWGTHNFRPPSMNVFVVTSNALNALVSLRHYARWHSHAAE